MKTLYIIDGHSQIFRAYYAPFRDLTSPDGEPTRATYVFTNMLLNFISKKKPDYLAMAIDGPRTKLERSEIFPDYKKTRKPTPEDFKPQEKRILEIVNAMGIPILESDKFEADDILATCVEKFASKDLRVVLVSRDKDLDQLLTTPNVCLYDPMKDETFDADAIVAKKGYTPAEAVEIQTLMGDSIDNIPGIAGVGPKTALKLIKKYGTADAVVQAADEQTPKLKQNLLAGADTIALSRKLVTLSRNVEIDLHLESMQAGVIHYDKVLPILDKLGVKKLRDRVAVLAGDDESADQEVKVLPDQTSAADCKYELIDDESKLDTLVSKLAKADSLAIDTETTSVDPMRAGLVGISLSCAPKEGFYIPVRGPLGATVLDVELVKTKLAPILEDAKIEKIGHNLKYDLIVLRNAGFELKGKFFDTMIAAWVLDSNRRSLKMDNLSEEILNHKCIPITDLIGKGKKQLSMDTILTETVAEYASEDADVTYRLACALKSDLEKTGLVKLYETLEMPLMPVLADMEMRGISVDPQKLKSMQAKMSTKADKLRDGIIKLAGRKFNPDSPKQLAEVLFDNLGLPVIKKTKTSRSTDSSVLEQLAGEHESQIAADLIEYRKLTKLLGTYLKGLADAINPTTNKIHTSFHQSAVATGRLSSSNPNLQNIPIRTDEGKLIRSAFIAPDGYQYLAADYSQVELRMMAHYCQDPTMMQAFKDDLDIHAIVAAEVFGVELDEVTSSQRAVAKTVNFGIIYGQTAFGLSNTLRIPRRQAAEFIQNYKARFPKIDEFLQSCVESAKKNGYVETIAGRRREVLDINSRNPQKRNLAERLAVNSTVQGSAADLIKIAMINIDHKISKNKLAAEMLLQIHDELIFRFPQGDSTEFESFVQKEMTSAMKLRVPLKVDIGVGKTWLDLK